jgi:iron(III) transport system ATP-binding protein
MLTVGLDRVSKTYGENAPTITMDTTIQEGEFFTLLGPSGCGKSTMLRMIAGFITPTTGRIRFGERDVTRLPANKRDTGMVFQNYALFPHLSVSENVEYGLKTRRTDRESRRRRVEEALENVGLGGYGDRRIDELSGGQQQRVALARAVVISPSLLLLDEPLSNLDAKLREETRQQIRRVQREAGITALYVTHDQAEAMAMSDRIAVLEGGRVHQIGTPREIYGQPATDFVARFIGNSNVVPGRVETVKPESAVVELVSGASLEVPRRPGTAVAADDAVSVSMRPESLSMVAPERGLLTGTVTQREYTGATSIVEVEASHGAMTVNLPDAAATAGVGDRVGLDVAPGATWLVVSE